MRKIVLLALAALAAAPAAAAAPTSAEYLVKMTMRDGERVVASPSLTVRAGSAATFMKSDQNYWVKLMATPVADGRVSLAFDSVQAKPGGLDHYGSTITVAADGTPASFGAQRQDPATGAATGMRFDVSVRAIGK